MKCLLKFALLSSLLLSFTPAFAMFGWLFGGEQSSPFIATVIEITTPEQIEYIVQSGRPAVIKFSASWCPPCQLLASYYHDVAQECEGVDFYCIDAEITEAMRPIVAKVIELGLLKEDLQGIPTIIFFQKDKVHEQIAGLPGMADLMNTNRTDIKTKEELVKELKGAFVKLVKQTFNIPRNNA